MASRLVTLLTDFGLGDPYVAEVKGRLHQEWARFPTLEPAPGVVDLTHDIPAGDIAAGAWFLERAHAAFPLGTVHLAIVDPGVGTSRPGLVVSAADHFFVGPGNGLFSFLLGPTEPTCAPQSPPAAIALDNPLYQRGPGGRPSSMFHGRDIFAPAAAHLSAGVPMTQLGRPVAPESIGCLSPVPTGRVVWVDRFGNAVTDLKQDGTAGQALADGGTVWIGLLEAVGPVVAYDAGPRDSAFWYWGSGGTIEVALRGESAATRFGLRVGMAVTWRTR